MGVTLEALHSLQEVERQLAEIRNKADGKRRQVRIHQRVIEKQSALIESKQRDVQVCQMEIDRVDLDVKTKEVTLAKHREALNTAKTNKEYAAILTSINTEKADSTKSESRQLELMANVDALRAEGDQHEAERAKAEQKKEEAEAKLKSYLDKVAPDVKRLEGERTVVAEGLAPSMLETFTRVAERHDGEAMAEVIVVNAKRGDYACGGCNLGLTLQQVIGCKERDDLVLCGTCGRILYIAS